MVTIRRQRHLIAVFSQIIAQQLTKFSIVIYNKNSHICHIDLCVEM